MKINIKQKDFLDKPNLQKSLSSLLKKPLNALLSKSVESLPFCYEAEYFDDGSGFISIGVCKEVQKHFKTKRAKGQGLDENGKAVKIDKKKVAFGKVSVNKEGVIDFNVMGGMMKAMQAKKAIKSIGILKKNIGDNFIITKGEAVEVTEAPTAENTSDSKATDTPVDTAAGTPPTDQAPESNVDLKGFAKEIIGQFKDIQKGFNGDIANDVITKTKDWINSFKKSDKEQKVANKDVGTTLQKVYKHVSSLLKIDGAIDKKIAAVTKSIDEFNDLVDHTTDTAKSMADNLSKTLTDLLKDAETLKDNELVKVIKEYISELKK